MLDPKRASKTKRSWIQIKAGTYLWPLIYKKPFCHTNKLLSLDPKKYASYQITDELYIKNQGSVLGEITVGSALILFGVWFLFYQSLGINFATCFIASWFVIPGILLILLALTKEDTGFVMDRLSGLISFPHGWWFKPVITYFDDAVVAITPTSKTISLKIARPGFFTGYYIITSTSNLEYWCFMVWYMDRNRPLPPDKVFDPYRQKDFERRKAEGFPPPLYPTRVPTPEATPEQQLEREQFWEESFIYENGKQYKYTSYPAHKYDKEKYG